jgi:adenosine deaminase
MLSKNDPAAILSKEREFTPESLKSYLHRLPKIELHAHLNGCIRESTLLQLASQRNVTLSSLLHDLREETHFSEEEKCNESAEEIVNKKRRSLLECFEIFAEIGKCVTDLEALRRIAEEALEDFAKEGVAYLELRSTPKILLNVMGGRKCTKREYVETILNVMQKFEEKELKRYERDVNAGREGGVRLPMKSRYIVSINRAESVEVAMEHAKLAIQLLEEGNKYVVGLDLSGNPLANTFKDLEPSFVLAKNAGLKTSIHCGEIPCEPTLGENSSSVQFGHQEITDILAFQPDRLGHALLLTDANFEELEKLPNKIPIECCPTSNVMTLELATYYEGDLVHGLRRHPRLGTWLDGDYPISISTDDPGIFNTDSTKELLLVAEAFKMDNPTRLETLMINSIDHIFESDFFKSDIRETIVKFVTTL